MATASRDSIGRHVCISLLFLAVLHVYMATSTQSWWSLGVTDCALSKGQCPTCGALSGALTESQQGQCSQDPKTIKAISSGARNAIIQCQSTFRNRKWNCSTFFGENLFGNFINRGTRETGVLNAYFTVGAITSLAIACREQRLVECPCDTDTSTAFSNNTLTILAGCSDNLDWAIDFARNFQLVDRTSESSSLSSAVGVHNVDLGESLVNSDGRTKICRCHGISGTCTAQTCYDASKTVEELSETLLIKYLGAVKVQKEEASDEIVPVDVNEQVDDSTLVFQEDSPNFCQLNLTEGVIGTRGRRCSNNQNDNDFCGDICCNGGLFQTISYEVPDEQCSFVWCCRIECTIVGTKTITEHYCRD